MKKLTSADYRRMPWRNGGGTTTELFVVSAESSDRFVARVSIADVASDGPFSRFADCDRHIMLVAGAGMTIDAGPHGIVLDLRSDFAAHSFSGDWEVTGRLMNGPVRDFNLIVDRTRASGHLESILLASGATYEAHRAENETMLLHVISGELRDAAASESILMREAIDERALELHALRETRLIVARCSTPR